MYGIKGRHHLGCAFLQSWGAYQGFSYKKVVIYILLKKKSIDEKMKSMITRFRGAHYIWALVGNQNPKQIIFKLYKELRSYVDLKYQTNKILTESPFDIFANRWHE